MLKLKLIILQTMTMKKAAKKKPAHKYEPKLKVEGSFLDLINAAVQPPKK